MNGDQDSVESYQFSLRQLRKYATDNQPDDVNSFLEMLALFAHFSLGGKTFQRQAEQEQKVEHESI